MTVDTIEPLERIVASVVAWLRFTRARRSEDIEVYGIVADEWPSDEDAAG